MTKIKETTPHGFDPIQKAIIGACECSASDIHFKVGEPPLYRTNGELKRLNTTPLTSEDLLTVVKLLIPHSAQNLKQAEWKQFDCSVEMRDLGRFRLNVFKQRDTLAITLRVIPPEIPSFTQLRLPLVLKRIAGLDRGLLLVTGATGMGKSTTIASMLDFINKNWCKHILTIENPIEFIIAGGRGTVSQREVGRDVEDFHTGLQDAFHQDPDIVFVGEIRDARTMELALQAAETGHFVVSAVHTPDVTHTISRAIGLFPPEERHTLRERLAENLKGIISQRLLPRRKTGRVLATEVLTTNYSIQECIRDPDSTPQDLLKRLENGMEEDQTQTFEQDLISLLKESLISLETAKSVVRNQSDFIRSLDLAR